MMLGEKELPTVRYARSALRLVASGEVTGPGRGLCPGARLPGLRSDRRPGPSRSWSTSRSRSRSTARTPRRRTRAWPSRGSTARGRVRGEGSPPGYSVEIDFRAPQANAKRARSSGSRRASGAATRRPARGKEVRFRAARSSERKRASFGSTRSWCAMRMRTTWSPSTRRASSGSSAGAPRPPAAGDEGRPIGRFDRARAEVGIRRHVDRRPPRIAAHRLLDGRAVVAADRLGDRRVVVTPGRSRGFASR